MRLRFASARAASIRPRSGCRKITPASPSSTTSSPSSTSSTSGPSPTTIGTPSERATMAARVVGGRRENWVAKLRQLQRAFLGGFAEGISGGTARFHHRRLQARRESRVARHERAGLDDVRLRVPTGVAKPKRDLLHLLRN